MVRRGNTFFVHNSLTSGTADSVFAYGDPGDTVLVGDWDGNGSDTLAVRRGGTYFVKNSLPAPAPPTPSSVTATPSDVRPRGGTGTARVATP